MIGCSFAFVAGMIRYLLCIVDRCDAIAVSNDARPAQGQNFCAYIHDNHRAPRGYDRSLHRLTLRDRHEHAVPDYGGRRCAIARGLRA